MHAQIVRTLIYMIHCYLNALMLDEGESEPK